MLRVCSDSRWRIAGALVVGVLTAFLLTVRGTPTTNKAGASNTGVPLPEIGETPGLSPARGAFAPNLGQWEYPARFVCRVGATTVFVEDRGWLLSLAETLGDTESQPARDTAPPQPTLQRGMSLFPWKLEGGQAAHEITRGPSPRRLHPS